MRHLEVTLVSFKNDSYVTYAMTETSRKPLTRKGSQTRAQILAAAEAVFCREGRAAISVQTICAAANIKRTVFYRYFPDAEAALATITDGASQLVAAIFVTEFEDLPHGYRRLRTCLGHVLTLARNDPKQARLLLALTRETPLIRTIADAEIRGQLRAENHPDADRVSRLISAGLFGYLDQFCQGYLPLSEVEAAADILMKSVR
jgi:AcrR family transcriptional regulator